MVSQQKFSINSVLTQLAQLTRAFSLTSSDRWTSRHGVFVLERASSEQTVEGVEDSSVPGSAGPARLGLAGQFNSFQTHFLRNHRPPTTREFLSWSSCSRVACEQMEGLLSFCAQRGSPVTNASLTTSGSPSQGLLRKSGTAISCGCF